MSSPIIIAENIGKRYVLNHQAAGGYRKFSDTIIHAAKAPLRLLNPSRAADEKVNSPEEFWALKDVSFEIQQGEVVGIIGRNGAGKSTLLKILSRITEPTTGRITLRGGVASLLEVGTGFHPELTGRENIFLNGAILGMARAEIKAKFDEIVAFAEIERFLDTPVKRYSSGMYVRLAFAVAAHLEPEILIVDEVLAVGDAQFQKKCLGKMQDVARGGRTVLFVSHNMAAIKAMTTRCLLLERGSLTAEGASGDMIARYVASSMASGSPDAGRRRSAGKHAQILSACIGSANGQEVTVQDTVPLPVEVMIATDGSPGMSLEAFLVSPSGERLALFSLAHFHGMHLPRRSGTYKCSLNLGSLALASGRYTVDLATSMTNIGFDDHLESALVLNVEYCNPSNLPWDMKQRDGFGSLAWPSQTAPQMTQVN